MIEHWGRETRRIDSRGRSPPKDTKGRSPLKRRILGANLTERNNARGEAHPKENERRMKPEGIQVGNETETVNENQNETNIGRNPRSGK